MQSFGKTSVGVNGVMPSGEKEEAFLRFAESQLFLGWAAGAQCYSRWGAVFSVVHHGAGAGEGAGPAHGEFKGQVRFSPFK